MSTNARARVTAAVARHNREQRAFEQRRCAHGKNPFHSESAPSVPAIFVTVWTVPVNGSLPVTGSGFMKAMRFLAVSSGIVMSE